MKQPLGAFAGLVVAGLLAIIFAACGGGANGAAGPEIAIGPLRVSGGGVAQFRERDADNSIEEYGHEAGIGELKQAAAAVHAYLVARAEKDWNAACTLVSRELEERVKAILGIGGPPVHQSCAKMLARLAPGEPPVADTPYKATEVDAGSLRVKGNTGFLFFNADTEGRKLIMSREGGEWKVAGLLPTALH